MGYNLELSRSGKLTHATDLCTNSGYSALCAWIVSLPRGRYPALEGIEAHGQWTDTDRLEDDFNAALVAHPPADPDVARVANRFADLVSGGDAGETAAVVE